MFEGDVDGGLVGQHVGHLLLRLLVGG